MNWRWVEEGDGYVGRLQPPGQPLGVGLPSGLQCLVPYPYRGGSRLSSAAVSESLPSLASSSMKRWWRRRGGGGRGGGAG